MRLQTGQVLHVEEILSQVPEWSRNRLLRELLLVATDYAVALPVSQTAGTPIHEAVAVQRTPPVDSTAGPGPGGAVDERLPDRAILLEGRFPIQFGEYELLRELGRGGMGIVYMAWQRQANRIVAIKLIHRSSSPADPKSAVKAMQRFRTEVSAAARLSHENIVAVYDVGTIGDQPFYAMRFVDGSSLAQLVRDAPLAPARAAKYLVTVARAVAAVHDADVLHRDLKPSNILIDGKTDTPLVSDFGLAKLTDERGNVTESGELFGSPPYMPPEQVLAPSAVTTAADIYSLGATLYHLLTGRPPFQAATIAETTAQVLASEPIRVRRLNSTIHRDLETICQKTLEKEPTRRYRSAHQLADDLQRYLDGRPVVARPLRWPNRMWRLARRNPLPSTLLMLVATTLLVGTIISTTLYYRATEFAEAEQQLSARLRNRLLLQARAQAQAEPGAAALPYLVQVLKLDQEAGADPWWDRVRMADQFEKCGRCEFLGLHDKLLNGLVFDHRGTRLVATSDDHSASIWNVATLKQLDTIKHPAPIYCAAFTADDRVLVTSDQAGNVKAWDADSFAPLGGGRHEKLVGRVAVSPEDDLIATASYDHSAMVWARDSWTSRANLLHPQAVIDCVFVSQHELATLCADGVIYRWNLDRGVLIDRIAHSSSSIRIMALSPDGRRLLSGAADGTVQSWDLADGVPRYTQSPQHAGPVTALCYSPSGRLFVSASRDGCARICAEATGQILHQLEHLSAVENASFLGDSSLATLTRTNGIRVWSVDSGTTIGPIMPVCGPGARMAVTARGDIAHSGRDAGVRLWHPQLGTPSANQESASATDCDVDRMTGRAVAISRDGLAFFHNLRESRTARLQQSVRARTAQLVAGLPKCIVGCADGAVLECETDDGKIERTWNHGAPVDSLRVSSSYVATAGGKSLKLWQYPSLELLDEITLERSKGSRVTSTPDGRYLALAEGAVLRLWACDKGALIPLRNLRESAPITSVSVHSSPFICLVTHADGAIRSCAKDGSEDVVRSAEGKTTFVQLNRAGTRILVGRREGDVQILDARTLDLAGGPFQHAATPELGAFAGADDAILTVTSDGFVHLWDAASAELISSRRSSGQLPFYVDFWEDDTSLFFCRGAADIVYEPIRAVANSIEDLERWSELLNGRSGSFQGSRLLTPEQMQALWPNRTVIRWQGRSGFALPPPPSFSH